MRALWLAVAVVTAAACAACSHAECAIDTDCPLGKFCSMSDHTCMQLGGGGDAGPRDAAPSDGAPGDGAPSDASHDAATDAGHDAGSDAGDPDAMTPVDAGDVDLGP